jgi:NTP pyrophosphatase (non-canonical NTP hydrolase)
MTFSDYQKDCKSTAIYVEHGTGLILAIAYCSLGFAGEAGETANKVKKLMRDGDTIAMRQKICEEIGDTLWYAAMLADELGVDLNSIALDNLKKLRQRKKLNVVKGEGDNR